MRKAIFFSVLIPLLILLSLVLFTTGCLSRKPLPIILPELKANESAHTIINPPRPHGKFKWLLVVRHTHLPEHTHFLYANRYRIVKESDGWVWLVPEGKHEIFEAVFPWDLAAHAKTIGFNDQSFVLMEYPTSAPMVFLRAAAPEPLSANLDVIRDNDQKELDWWASRSEIIKLEPRGAKAVFTPETKN